MACVCVARGSLWRLHLALHLFLLVILLPLVQFALLLRRKLHLSQELALGLALAPLAAWLQLFYMMGDIFPLVASEAELAGESLLYRPMLRTLGTAGVIGVSVMAVLSGWSSVVSPTSSISRLLAPVAESDLRAAERSVLYSLQAAPRYTPRNTPRNTPCNTPCNTSCNTPCNTPRSAPCSAPCSARSDACSVLCALQIMLRQRHTLALVRQQQRAAMEADTTAHGALDRTPGMAVRLGRLVWALLLPLRSASYRSAREGVGAVQRELAATRKLLHHQLWALSEMCDERERAAYATTLLGRWNNLLGLFFAGYGTYKVIFALGSEPQPQPPTPTPTPTLILTLTLTLQGHLRARLHTLPPAPLEAGADALPCRRLRAGPGTLAGRGRCQLLEPGALPSDHPSAPIERRVTS